MKNVEVEIQVVIKNPKKVEERLNEVGKFIKERKEKDKYYVTPDRNFFDKETPNEYLRIRYEDGANHLNYSYIDFDKKGWIKASNEYETLIDKPEIVEEIFERIGLIQKVIVTKIRKYFKCDDFEVTLDRIENLGDFMEVEAKKDFGGVVKTRKACLDFLESLNVEYEMKKEAGYPRMLYKKLNKK